MSFRRYSTKINAIKAICPFLNFRTLTLYSPFCLVHANGSTKASMATSTISAPSQALLAASARPKSSSCALPRMPVAILAKIGRAACQLLQPMRPRPDRGMHSITASSLQGVAAAPLLVSIDSASIVHLVAAGCRHRPDLCEAALEVPNCSDATHDGHVAPTSSFTPDPSTASKARPRRRRTQHRAPPASWRPPSCQKRRFSYAYCTTQANLLERIFNV